MRNGSSTTTISPPGDRHRNPAAAESRLLRVVSAGPAETAPSAVVRVGLGPSQWALVAQPAGLQLLRPPPALAGPFIRPLPGQFALVPIPWLPDPRLGTAVLFYRRGETLIYCPERHITDRAAEILSALADEALAVVLGRGHPEPTLTVTREVCSELPADRSHVASAELRGFDIVFLVCSRLISAEFADTLGLLCTAHARDLLQLGQLSTDHAASSS